MGYAICRVVNGGIGGLCGGSGMQSEGAQTCLGSGRDRVPHQDYERMNSGCAQVRKHVGVLLETDAPGAVN